MRLGKPLAVGFAEEREQPEHEPTTASGAAAADAGAETAVDPAAETAVEAAVEAGDRGAVAAGAEATAPR
ncbi:hypothetical protein [Streptomyces varsoviensis]|uniref:Uncharacterized protein n=1 Tax=Streptomyces varsoviensis TaxID=67373 RepID=A0ABR5IXQ6_9ACTN|nr:hypothetical protein [Streptomyces varsoviensis]KOG85936.1 hypothetical protein ADK38_33860 [Streptomyces varsoviensis]